MPCAHPATLTVMLQCSLVLSAHAGSSYLLTSTPHLVGWIQDAGQVHTSRLVESEISLSPQQILRGALSPEFGVGKEQTTPRPHSQSVMYLKFLSALESQAGRGAVAGVAPAPTFPGLTPGMQGSACSLQGRLISDPESREIGS